jgi:large subunit ribosomal protein L23
MTEKASLVGQFANAYVFKVNPKASKIDVKNAVENEYKVTVNKVNIINVKGKIKRSMTARGKISKKPNWKKAYVALKEGDRIEITQD